MKKKTIKSNLKSTCCNAEIKTNMVPDFIGDNPKNMIIGTCYYICTKCDEPCNSYLKERKTWKINPATKIIGDKREKIHKKEINKEIKEIGNA